MFLGPGLYKSKENELSTKHACIESLCSWQWMWCEQLSCPSYFFVNLAQVRVKWEEEPHLRKCIHQSSSNKSVGAFSCLIVDRGGPSLLLVVPLLDSSGLYKKGWANYGEQTSMQHSSTASALVPASRILPCLSPWLPFIQGKINHWHEINQTMACLKHLLLWLFLKWWTVT